MSEQHIPNLWFAALVRDTRASCVSMCQAGLRILVASPLVIIFGLLILPSSAGAVEGVAGMMLLRDLPPDVIFFAGVPKTVEIPLTFYLAPMTNVVGQSACHGQGWIQSTLPAVTIHGPCYGTTGCSEPYLLVAGLDANAAVGPDTAFPYGLEVAETLTLQYDGSGGPAEASIKISTTIGSAGLGCSGDITELSQRREIGAINVHVVPSGWASPPSTFQVTSTNPIWNFFYLSNPFLDGHPDARIIVTPVQEYPGIVGPPATAYKGMPVGVWYNSNLGQWSIYNETGAAMTDNQRFNVTFAGYQGQRSFLHTTDASNTSWTVTYLSDSRLNSVGMETPHNGNPFARAFVTHVWNPPGHATNYFPYNFGLWFDSNSQRWAIYREDLGPMPLGATFNIVVAAAPSFVESYPSVGLWSFETGVDGPGQPMHFTHVWSNPLTGNTGTYFDYVPVARWTHWCAPPPFYCTSRTVPGRYDAAVSSTDYLFSRWVPSNAM